MGMYTELIFQGKTKSDLASDINELIYYFFDENSEDLMDKYKAPDHPLFKCTRWRQIGRCGSYYFNPFSLRYSADYGHLLVSKHVFLRCDLKNYDSEIEHFLDWIKPHMENCWGYFWYEEDESPTVFKYFGK